MTPLNLCERFGLPCPLANVRPAREQEITVVHCERCGAELVVGPLGELPPCPVCAARKERR